MAEFKKGQLVAVRYGPSWEPRIFRRKDDDGLWCMDFLSHGASPYTQEDVEPAEAVWPEIFLGWERKAGEQAAEAVAMESELVQRLRRQIAWLCNGLKNDARTEENNPLCPLNVPWDCKHTPCDKCWEQASLKAVEGANNG